MRICITVIHIIISSTLALWQLFLHYIALILLVFSQRLTEDQIHVLVFMPTGCQVVSLPVGETAPWTSGYIRPNPDGLQPVSSFVWLSFEGVGWATLRLGGGLPWCQLCHLCAASPSHPLWKSEKMPNNGELRKSLKQIAFATIPNNAQIFAELSVCPINNNNCRCL